MQRTSRELVTFATLRCAAAVVLGVTNMSSLACSGGDTPVDDRDADDRDIDGDDGRTPAPSSACQDVPLEPGSSLVRRLTHRELANTVRDVLEIDLDETIAGFPREIKEGGFSNNAHGSLAVSLQQAEGYDDLSSKIVERIEDWGVFIARHGDCADFAGNCAETFVTKLGLRLLRRPLSEEQKALYLALFDAVRQGGDDFAVGAAVVLQAMVQAPQFLYRIEREAGDEGAHAVDDFEMASRLSYLLWGSAPDEALLEAAAEGRLHEPDGIRAETERLLGDERARANLAAYVGDWLNLDALTDATRDKERFPDFDAALVADMRSETTRFFQALWDDRTALAEMFTGKRTFASPRLATHYGLEPGDDAIDLTSVTERIGFLTQASFLTVTSHGDEPSMVHRGLFVLRNILCEDIPPPPESVMALPVKSEPGKTQRTAALERGDNPACTGCHGSIDPLAFALEPYDSIGRHAREDQHGNSLRSDGQVVLQGEPYAYDTVGDFARILAGSPQVAGCMVQKAVQFATGRLLSPQGERSHTCLLENVAGRFANTGDSFPDLFHAIATHPAYQLVRGD